MGRVKKGRRGRHKWIREVMKKLEERRSGRSEKCKSRL